MIVRGAIDVGLLEICRESDFYFEIDLANCLVVLGGVASKVIGQFQRCIKSGDRGVVTNMRKNKKRKVNMIFHYIPSETVYTPQQESNFITKEQQLINLVIERLLPEKAPAK
ncbi:hypothetical protein ACF3MZ_13415 [Paenibacillaceae bacterium WGS1546]|uniref:hypothetical protein n=1 Tax=Cohnella sp. WGS1546 TaxID=3366810 RepID=UPI00372D7453